MALYRGKCLTGINSDVSICLCIFNFFIYYYFSVLCPVDVQGMLFRCSMFCCGYNNVTILFSGSPWVHGNGNKNKRCSCWKENHKYSRSVFCGNCISDVSLVIVTGGLVRLGISPGRSWPVLKIVCGCFMEVVCSDQKFCCSKLVTEENMKKKAASFLLPVLTLTVLWKVF